MRAIKYRTLNICFGDSKTETLSGGWKTDSRKITSNIPNVTSKEQDEKHPMKYASSFHVSKVQTYSTTERYALAMKYLSGINSERDRPYLIVPQEFSLDTREKFLNTILGSP
ncbi:hypothetical protein CEXT_534981 [Caerostris extrusa]|uniref:Uncharacterized protein n=1 Tax=Caerostris extrusa TaxID=172846 RepID=A0AAV4YAB7_CAEEX|nr:hypothetical protein CEXT_534981 [Caerostris extrusa]